MTFLYGEALEKKKKSQHFLEISKKILIGSF